MQKQEIKIKQKGICNQVHSQIKIHRSNGIVAVAFSILILSFNKARKTVVES